jgi:glycosyltransferase involved in cell wall biosynthesis
MKIAIKATHITYGGGLTHLNRMIEWFSRLAPETAFVVLGKSGQEKMFVEAPGNFEYRFFRAPSLNLFAQVFWERYRLAGIVKEIGCDLLFEPGNYGAGRVHCPKVTLIHNIAPFDSQYIKKENPYQKIRLKFLRRATIRSMRSSQGIIYLSEYCRDFCSGYMDDSSQKTAAIFHGRPELSKDADSLDVLHKYGIDSEYILSVSHIYRYKKIKEMVQSYLYALGINPDLPPLCIAGSDYDSEYMRQIGRIIKKDSRGDKVRFLGAVPEADLQALYRNCRAFLFTSVLETCSVILIEAMAHGCALVCSNRGAVPEVTGGAALYSDPDDMEDLAFKIRAVIEDEDLNLFLRNRSKKRSEFFSWKKTARETLDFFDEVLSDHVRDWSGGPKQQKTMAGKSSEKVYS